MSDPEGPAELHTFTLIKNLIDWLDSQRRFRGGALIRAPDTRRAIHRASGLCDHGSRIGDSGVVRKLLAGPARQSSGSNESTAAGIAAGARFVIG